MVHSIEKINLDKPNLLIETNYFFPNEEDKLFSKKEKEVLMLNSEQDLGIVITRGRKLMLRIPKIKTLRSKRAIWDYQIGLLKQMGFQWD